MNRRCSVRGIALGVVVRVLTKRRPPPGRLAVARQARGIFGTPRWVSAAWSVFGGVAVEQVDCGVRCERLIGPVAPEMTLVYFHGGGYVSCSPQTHRPITITLTRLLRACTYVPDYRLAPEHPFPAAVDDAFAVYEQLCSEPETRMPLVLAGDSAGGGLAIATALRARDAGLPAASTILTFSPWVDLTPGREPRLRQREHLCDMFYAESFAAYSDTYLHGSDPHAPHASPLYAELHNLPPLLIEVSDSELLYEEALQLSDRWRASDNVMELHVSAGLPHGWQMSTPFVPEARLSLHRAADFGRRH